MDLLHFKHPDSFHQFRLRRREQIAVDVFTFISLGCIKASALFFIRQVFRILSNRVLDIVLVISLIIVACWTVVFVFLADFQCGTHLSATWSGLAAYTKYCVLSFPFLYGLAVSDFLLDLWIIALPLPVVVHLHATPGKKLAIAGVFLLSLGALAGSAARMAEFIIVENLGPLGLAHDDPNEIFLRSEFFIILENGLSVLAINAVALWSLFSKDATPDEVLSSMRKRNLLASGVEEDEGQDSVHPAPANANHEGIGGEAYEMATQNRS